MKIAILNVDNINSESSISQVEPFANPVSWLGENDWERFYISKLQSKKQVTEILTAKFDVIFNLCDGAVGDDRPGIEVVKILEETNIPFTGASSGFYEPTRKEMKMACIKAGIRFPRGFEIYSLSETESLKDLNFPMIVKHPNSYNSIGMTKDSVVFNENSLIAEISRMLEKFKGSLVEEYIDGSEYTALVVENAKQPSNPVVFQPMEVLFPEGESFKHFDLKWKSHVSMKYIPVKNAHISDKIKQMSSSMFKAMNGNGYARCDLRMNSSGELFMLEINPNCSIYFPENDPSSADEILFSETGGHELFTKMILENAFKRCR